MKYDIHNIIGFVDDWSRVCLSEESVSISKTLPTPTMNTLNANIQCVNLVVM